MYIRSGELVIILGVKKYLKRSRLGSLRFQIGFLIILAGIIPVLIIEGVLLSTYEKRAVNVRTAGFRVNVQFYAINWVTAVT